jgi:hypothetical protein
LHTIDAMDRISSTRLLIRSISAIFRSGAFGAGSPTEGAQHGTDNTAGLVSRHLPARDRALLGRCGLDPYQPRDPAAARPAGRTRHLLGREDRFLALSKHRTTI